MSKLRPAHVLAAALVLASAAAVAKAETEAMLASLAGRWSGWGSIVMAAGATEKVRCVVTYDIAATGSTLHQRLRCASASYRIDADADLELSDGAVAGRWSERNYAAEGTVKGRASAAGMNLSIEGDHFSAVMALTASPCNQAITIAPRGIDVARVSMELSKC